MEQVTMAELIFKEECYAIIGACMEVYNEMGHGFLESVYQECLEIEMEARAIPFVGQSVLDLKYKGRPLKQGYSPDFMCFGSIVVEIKAVSAISDAHRAQVMNYLKASGVKVGLLVNFGAPGGLQFERIVM
jgi:GxxExxY protein